MGFRRLGRFEIVTMENERGIWVGNHREFTSFNDFALAAPSCPEADMEHSHSKMPSFFPKLGFNQVSIKENSVREFQVFSWTCKYENMQRPKLNRKGQQGG